MQESFGKRLIFQLLGAVWIAIASCGEVGWARDLKSAPRNPKITDGIECFGVDSTSGTSVAVATRPGPLIHTAQILPTDGAGIVVEPGSARKQAQHVLKKLEEIIDRVATTRGTIIKLNVYLSRSEIMPEVKEVLAQFFAGPLKPALSVVVSSLPASDVMVAMDAVAVCGDAGEVSQAKQGIQDCRVLPQGPVYYVSGMADTNSLPEATQQTLRKLVAAIGHLGLAKSNIVQLKAFLQPMTEAAAVRQQIVKFFDGAAPPTIFVEWISPAPNPPIEIELIAGGGGDFTKEPEAISFLTPPGTTSTKVFSRVARVNHGRMVYISGLYGTTAQDAEGQTRKIFASLGEILKHMGSDFENLAKATYYVSDDAASDALNTIRPQFYNPQRPPAASKAKVRSVGAAGKSVTLDMIAVVP